MKDSHAKIGNDDIRTLFSVSVEDILGPDNKNDQMIKALEINSGENEDSLEIAMDDLVAMAVLDGADDLLKESARFLLLHPPSIDNVLKELAASVLDDHDDV